MKPDKLTRSTAHLMLPNVRVWCLALAWWRLARRKQAEQLRLKMEGK